MLEGEPTDGVSQEVVLEPQEQAVSPAGASLEIPLAVSQPLQRRGHSRLVATPAVTRAGTAAQSFVGSNAYNRSDSSHLTTIATGPALSELRGLRLYTKETLPDIRMRRAEQTLPLNTYTPRRPIQAVRPGRMRK